MYSTAKFKLIDGIWHGTSWEELKKNDVVRFLAGYQVPITFQNIPPCILTTDPEQDEEGLWSVKMERIEKWK